MRRHVPQLASLLLLALVAPARAQAETHAPAGPDRKQTKELLAKIDTAFNPRDLPALLGNLRSTHKTLTAQFEAERELLRTRVRELRANLQARRLDLRRLRQTRASDDGIATLTGNIERLRAQIGDLIEAYEVLQRRRDSALRALPGVLKQPAAATSAAVAEAERLLREDRR